MKRWSFFRTSQALWWFNDFNTVLDQFMIFVLTHLKIKLYYVLCDIDLYPFADIEGVNGDCKWSIGKIRIPTPYEIFFGSTPDICISYTVISLQVWWVESEVEMNSIEVSNNSVRDKRKWQSEITVLTNTVLIFMNFRFKLEIPTSHHAYIQNETKEAVEKIART